MNKFSVATHRHPVTGATEGLTVEGVRVAEEDGVLRIFAEDRSLIAVFPKGEWLHVFNVEASK